MNQIAPYAKAVAAALIAALGALGTALTDEAVTGFEWVAVALAGLVALGAVFGVSNQPADYDGEHRADR